MTGRIKGITVEIGGDTTKLSKALQNVEKNLKNTQTQLKDVEKLLKLDPKNTELLAQKQKLLADAVSTTKDKLDTLKKASEQAARTKDNYDAWKAKYDPLKQKISETETKLRELKEQSKTADEQLSRGKISQEKDKKFEDNYNGAKAAGIPVGAYWYSYAKTVDEARQEAEACITILRSKQFEYPIFFDVEEKATLNTGKSNCSAMIRAFCEALERAGYWVGLYTSRSVLGTHIVDDIKTRYAIWAADWNNKLNYSGAVGIWQYSDKGRVDGISGNVDLDESYIDYASSSRSEG